MPSSDHPISKRLQQQLKRCRQGATKINKGLYHPPFKARLKYWGLLNVEERQLREDRIQSFVKKVDKENFVPSLNNTQTGDHPVKLSISGFRTDQKENIFAQCIINL